MSTSDPLVSFDTETPPGTALVKIPPLVCFSYCDEQEAWACRWDDPRAKRTFAHALQYCVSAGANIAYDVAVCLREWPELTTLAWDAYQDGRIRDVIQCERLLCIAEGGFLKGAPGSLDDLSMKYGYGPLDKDPAHRVTYGQFRS